MDTSGDDASRDAEEVDEEKRVEFLNTAIPRCIEHATTLLRAARVVHDTGIPNVAYHLAVLALEEIGKSELIVLDTLAGGSDEGATNYAKHYEKHTDKLFFALWLPSIGRQKLTRNQIQSDRDLARAIHELRKRGIYFDPDDAHRAGPAEVISGEESERMIRIVEYRLQMAEPTRFRKLDEEDRQTFAWLRAASQHPIKRNLMFGDRSMDKLAEMGDRAAWARWVRRDIEARETAATEVIRRELAATPCPDEDADKPKWRFEVRFYTNSHRVVRPPLRRWNAVGSWIKLYPVGGKTDQLTAQFTLPKTVSLDRLWWVGWGATRRFATALNIGSMGFFWWYLPRDISRFYDSLRDLENNTILVVERDPILKLDWQRDTLAEGDLNRTALCLGSLPSPSDAEHLAPFDKYISALSYLSKNDIHLQTELLAFRDFYSAFKLGMQAYGDWDGTARYWDAFEGVTEEFVPEAAERTKYRELSERAVDGPPFPTDITLSEVGTMKTFCDYYFLRRFEQAARRRGDPASGAEEP